MSFGEPMMLSEDYTIYTGTIKEILSLTGIEGDLPISAQEFLLKRESGEIQFDSSVKYCVATSDLIYFSNNGFLKFKNDPIELNRIVNNFKEEQISFNQDSFNSIDGKILRLSNSNQRIDIKGNKAYSNCGFLLYGVFNNELECDDFIWRNNTLIGEKETKESPFFKRSNHPNVSICTISSTGFNLGYIQNIQDEKVILIGQKTK